MQVANWTCAPAVAEAAAKHSPELALRIVPSPGIDQPCDPPPLHVHNWIGVPATYLLDVTSRHEPPICNEPLPGT